MITYPARKLLRVTAPHFVAGAVWERQSLKDGWQCTSAAPIIDWMKNRSAVEVFAYLETKHWKYEWLNY